MRRAGNGAQRRTSGPLAFPTLFKTFPMPLRLLVREFERGAHPPQKVCRSSDDILELPDKPQVRPASHQRTSGCSTAEELFERSVRVAGLEMERLPTAAPAEPSARKAAKPLEASSRTAREASSSSSIASARPVLEAFLTELIVDAALLGVGEDLVGLGNVFELLRRPRLLLLVLVWVVLER